MTALQNVWARHQGLPSSSPIDNTRFASSDNSGGNPPSVEARTTAQIAPHYEQLTQPAYSTAQLNRLSPLSAGVAKLCRRENLPNTVGAILGVVALAGSVYAVSASQESATFQSLLDTLLGLFKPMSELSHDMVDVMRDGQQVVDSVTGTLAHTSGAFASVMDTVNRALLPLLRTAIPVALGSTTMATSSTSTIFKTLDQLQARAANDGGPTFTEEAIETLKRLTSNRTELTQLLAALEGGVNHVTEHVSLLTHQMLDQTVDVLEALPEEEISAMVSSAVNSLTHADRALVAGRTVLSESKPNMVESAKGLIDHSDVALDDVIAIVNSLGGLFTALSDLTHAAKEVTDLNELDDIWEAPDHATIQTDFSGAIKEIELCEGDQGFDPLGVKAALCQVTQQIKDKIADSGVIDTVAETVTDAADHLLLWGQSVEAPVTNIQIGLGRLAQHLDVTHSGLSDMRALLGGVGGQLKGLNSDAVGAIDHIAQSLESAKLTMRGFTEKIDPIDSEMTSIETVLEQVAPGLEDFKAGMAALDRLMQENPLPLFIDLLNQIQGDLSHTTNEGQVIGNALHELTASVEPMLADVAQVLNTIESLQTMLANSDVPELDYGNLSETLSGFNQQLLDLAQHQPAFLQSIESVVSLNSIVQNLNQQMLSSVQRYQGRAQMIASEQSLRSMSSHFATLGSDEVKETAHLLLVPIKIAVVTLCVVTTAYLGRQVTELLVNATSKTTTPSSQPHSDVETGSGQMVVDMRHDGVSRHDLSDLGSVHDLENFNDLGGVDDQD